MNATLRLLLVDDDVADHLLVELTLAQQPHPYALTSVFGAAAALHHLESASQPPDLILLDIHMPGMDGFELLTHLKAQPRWRAIPVVMFSTSLEESDLRRAYQLQASGYLTKYDGLPQLAEQFAALLAFWQRAALPPWSAAGR